MPVVDAIAQNRKKNIEGQMDLFGMGNDEVQRHADRAARTFRKCSKRELLAMEKETTGLYLSGHPMDEYRELAQLAPRLRSVQAGSSTTFRARARSRSTGTA